MPFCHLHLKAQKPKNLAYPSALHTLGDHFRAKRLDLGLLQKQVAEKVGVDETSVYNWENNRVEPAVRFIPRIIGFLGYCPYMPELPVSEWLRLVRQSLGLSQEKLADALRIDEGTWKRWEIGQRQPAFAYLGRIKTFLDSREGD